MPMKRISFAGSAPVPERTNLRDEGGLLLIVHPRLKGILCVIAASFIWGTMGPAGKSLAMLGTDMGSVAWSRALFMLSGFGVYLFFRDRSAFRINRRQAVFLALFGLFGTYGMYAGFFRALQHLSVALNEVVIATYPLMTSLGAVLVNKEPLSAKKIAMALLSMAGILIAVYPSLGFGADSISGIGLFWAFAAAVAMASYSLFGRLSAQSGFVSQGTLLLYSQVFGLFWLTLDKTFGTGWGDLCFLTARQFSLMLYLGLFASVGGWALYFFGLRTVPASTASIIGMNEVVTAMLIAALWLGQAPSWNEIAGAAIILCAVFAASREPMSRDAA